MSARTSPAARSPHSETGLRQTAPPRGVATPLGAARIPETVSSIAPGGQTPDARRSPVATILGLDGPVVVLPAGLVPLAAVAIRAGLAEVERRDGCRARPELWELVRLLESASRAPAAPLIEERWLTTSEASTILGVGDRAVRYVCKRKTLDSHLDTRGRWQIAASSVDAYLHRHDQPGNSDLSNHEFARSRVAGAA